MDSLLGRRQIRLKNSRNTSKLKNPPILEDFLSEFCSIWNFSLRYSEYYRAIFSVESCTKKFAHKWSNLFWREIHDSDYLLADQLIFRVVCSDLRTGLFDSDFSSEIDPDFISTLTSLWEIFYTQYRTDTEFDGFKF